MMRQIIQLLLRWSLSICLVGLLGYSQLVSAIVRISDLNDFSFGRYIGFGNLRSQDGVCVTTLPASRYQITFWGSGAGGAFEISNGVDALDYRVRYNDRANNAGARNVSPGIPLTGQRNSSTQLNCDNGLDGNIDIRFRQRDLQAANPGRYIGVLTIMVAPE